MEPQLKLWTPSNTDIHTIDKEADYSVSLEDVELVVTPMTPFLDNGRRVRINGHRLYYLLKNANKPTPESKRSSAAKLPLRKSLKNVCFREASTKSDVAALFRTKLKMPDCMQRFLNDFEIRPRGKRFRKRFIFNTYIANVLTCTKCDKMCLVDAMALLYEQEEKCIQEFDRLLFQNLTLYKPPNCINMKNKDNLCFKLGTCKGSNPICNY